VPRWESRPLEGEEALGPPQLATEAVALGLRTTAGIDLDAFAARYGIDLLTANDALVARLTSEGRLVLSRGTDGERRLVPTLPGLAVADGLAAAFDVTLPS
jgi:coproporphyrinogen III oxidase-like Fe-S oxidoreductase